MGGDLTTCSPSNVTRMRSPLPGCSTMNLQQQKQNREPLVKNKSKNDDVHCSIQSEPQMNNLSGGMEAAAAHLHPKFQTCIPPSSGILCITKSGVCVVVGGGGGGRLHIACVVAAALCKSKHEYLQIES